MATRTRLTEASPYFAKLAKDKGLPFVSTGCSLLDCALGGGAVLGRILNIVGDKSTGKTLQTIEITVNFFATYAEGLVRYAEVESAFDDDYAAALGWPEDRVERPDDGAVETVEDFFADVEATIARLDGRPAIYIVDSLDALSTRAELDRKPGEATYGTEKAKMMSEGFRKLVRRIERSRMLLIVISQVRENIGVTFGAKYTRSGGKALDFYASQVMWLADLGKIKRTSGGQERVVGLNVKAQIKKNKVGLAWRDVEYPIIFGYGIDDLQAGIEWLFKTGGHKILDEMRLTSKGVTTAMQKLRDQGPAALVVTRQRVSDAVQQRWVEIESSLLPKARKY